MIRQAHLMAVVGVFLIWCAVLLLVVGCAGTRPEGSQEEEQGSPPQATASEEARCEGTRTYHLYQVVHRPGYRNGPLRTGSEEDVKKAAKKAGQMTMDFGVYTTNDLPGCPEDGLLLGTDKPDKLDGREGDDEMRGLGGSDHYLDGGPGSDTIHGGDGNDAPNPPDPLSTPPPTREALSTSEGGEGLDGGGESIVSVRARPPVPLI